MEVNGVRLTPTQLKIMEVLKDGKPHMRHELLNLIDDFVPGSDKDPRRAALHVHMSVLRGKLRPLGKDLLCDLTGHISYRMVQHVKEPSRIDGEIFLA